MTGKPTVRIPEDWEPPTPKAGAPMFAFVDVFGAGSDADGRDVSKPVAYDEHGKPLYAPTGILLQSPHGST